MSERGSRRASRAWTAQRAERTSGSEEGIDALGVLRAATAEIHARLDASLGLLDAELTTARYAGVLRGFRAAVGVAEPALAAHAAVLARHGYVVVERAKAHWLDADLADLGDAAALPVLEGSYRLDTPAAAFGAAYVLEGATLGGQVIARHVVPLLGLQPPRGCRYLLSYGEATGGRWRDTCFSIRTFFTAEHARPESLGEAARAAVATFELFSAAAVSPR